MKKLSAAALCKNPMAELKKESFTILLIYHGWKLKMSGEN